jgi:hypothetical protein
MNIEKGQPQRTIAPFSMYREDRILRRHCSPASSPARVTLNLFQGPVLGPLGGSTLDAETGSP